MRARIKLDLIVSVAVLVVLFIYTFGFLFMDPYIGFVYYPNTGAVENIFLGDHSSSGLKIQDQIEKIGAVTRTQFLVEHNYDFIQQIVPGKMIPIEILRGGSRQTVEWVSPGFTVSEFQYRFFGIWWLAWVFWFFGTLALVLVRPKDARWRLLVAFYYLTALFLMMGNDSSTGFGKSDIILRSVMWICVPVYLNFHWLFPEPIRPRRSLAPVFQVLSVILYLVFASLSIAEWIRFTQVSSLFLGLALAVGGSIVLLIIHAFIQPAQRKNLVFLAFAIVVAILPHLISTQTGFNYRYPWYLALTLLALHLYPAAYFIVIYQSQLGGLRLRANRLITNYIFFALMTGFFTTLVFLGYGLFTFPASALVIGVITPLLATAFVIFGYPRFERWFEQKILGMPIPPTHLLEIYSARITTSLDTERLVSLIRDGIMPSLLVRQATLLRLEAKKSESETFSGKPVFMLGITAAQLPLPHEIPLLIGQSGELRYTPHLDSNQPCPWVRLALVLTIEGQPVGLCLFGRRDPDDIYAPTEIPILQILMNQAALALVNIDQARRLHALYQADIGRFEEERRRLALDLHDEVLRQLALVSMSVDERQAGLAFTTAYQATVDRIRQITSGLRPAMLNYGLYTALQELTDETSTQVGEQVDVELDVAPGSARYPSDAELHLYRIIQQACQNAVQHAHATVIRIHGRLEAEGVDLTVQDNGAGFASGEELDLPGLLANRHFGLAGMHERAALIGARVSIRSAAQVGTRVRVVWDSGNRPNSEPA